ncbi:stalk domain-containing protein, partial [Peptoniphilus grossensis]|uniref:stalk domain-containing protein n=1 Tax=Peptoniphilus grossensis TaxID=1465756 RepID=UPI0039946140
NNPELDELYCAHNQLTALDVTNNPKLIFLWCNGNQLTSLNLLANTEIDNFRGYDQKYNIEVSKSDLTFDLSSLPGSFVPSKASEWKGGSVSGNTLKLNDADTNEVTYKYTARSPKFLDVTLNVKYKEQFTISFDSNDGSGSMADVKVDKGSMYSLPACKFTAPAGKEFKAWEVGGVEKAVGDRITVNANTTVKALWKDKTPETYTITFDSNGGSGTMADVTINAGESYVLPECGFTAPAGKEFKDWEVDGDEMAPNDSITVNADTKVKALWKDEDPGPEPGETHDVNITPATNGTVTADKTKAKQGEIVTLTITPDAGYEIDEIRVMDDGANNVPVTDNKFTMPDMLVNVTVTFKEKPVTPPIGTPVKITFDKNGGSGSMADVTKKNGESFTLPACGFTAPAGKEFKAWQVDGTEKNVGDTIVLNGDKTIKAVWKDIGSLPPTPPVPPTPYTPYPWIVYPGWYYETERPKSIEEKKINSVVIDWKIQLTIGKDLLHKEINGVESNIKMDIAPYIKDGRTMLPIRYVAEALGFDVEWIKSTRTVLLKDNNTRVEIPVDTNKIIVNGTVYTSDVKPEIKNNRTMLPIANIARALGLQDGKDIIWNSKSKTVTIYRSIVVK